MNTLFKTITNSHTPHQNSKPSTSVVSLHETYDIEHKILIEDLELDMSIGILPEEKEAKQRVIINLEIFIEPKADYAEDIKNTVSYADIIEKIETLTDDKHFNLVETLAQDISNLCFGYNSVNRVAVSIKKPDIISNVKSVGFSMVREQ